MRAFGDAVTRLDWRYHRLARSNGWDQDAVLQITEIRSGSTEIEIAAMAGTAHAAITAATDLSTVVKFGKDLAGLFGIFSKPKPPLDGLAITDCDDTRALIKPAITADSGGMSISIVGDNNFVQPVLIRLDHQEAREVDNRAALAK